MKIYVDLDVRVESGARIELTESQTTKIEQFVKDVVFGAVVEQPKQKRAYVKQNKRRQWTLEEDRAILEAKRLQMGKPRSIAFRQIANTYKRTRAAVSQRGSFLVNQPRKIAVTYLG